MPQAGSVHHFGICFGVVLQQGLAVAQTRVRWVVSWAGSVEKQFIESNAVHLSGKSHILGSLRSREMSESVIDTGNRNMVDPC